MCIRDRSNGEPNPYRDGATETPVDEGDPIDNANAPPPTISVATEDAPAASPLPPPPPAPAAPPPSAESPSETREQEQRLPREDRGPDPVSYTHLTLPTSDLV